MLASVVLVAVIVLVRGMPIASGQRSAGVADVSPEQRESTRQLEEKRRAEEAAARAQVERESVRRNRSEPERCCDSQYIEIDEAAILRR